MAEANKANIIKSKGNEMAPSYLRWCLSIFHVSPAAYKQIASKRNKFLALSHINALKK